jgi:DNA-binding response OmpR family regulator
MVILDVRLPDADGIDLLRELRQDPRTANFPVIMLSAEVAVRDRALGLRTGADDYIGKPYEAGYIVARVQELVRPHQSPAGSRHATILVIDDSVTFRRALADALSADGYRVLEAGTGEEGLHLAGSARPQAIVVDGIMPGMSGAEVVRQVRLDVALRHVPCMLLTASGDRQDELMALGSGADVFARKDEAIPVILARLAAMLRTSAGTEDGGTASLLGPKKILLASDDRDVHDGLGGDLRRDGYDVVHAHSETAVLDLLGVQRVDCILLDVRLCGADAEVMCRRLKEAEGLHGIPLVLVADGGDQAAMIRCLAAGADDYLEHRRDGAVVRARVMAQIRRRRFEDEQQRHREQLMVSDRLASVGMLAAGVAHEINNPLAAIIVNLDLALRDVRRLGESPLAASLMEGLTDAQEAAERLKHIVGDLRIFSRSRTEATEPIDILSVLESTMRLAWTEIRHRATLVRRLRPVPLVLGSESRLGQVFLNLLINAAQAIPEGRADQHEIRVTTGTDSYGRIVVDVQDTGAGMSPMVMKQLFTPFFTTKPVGTGTGLGLSICQRIVSGLGGEIVVESEPGKGSTFRVLLPPVAADVDLDDDEVETPMAFRRRGRLLVIDDEPAILNALCRALQADHQVEATVSAREALTWIREGRRFDVILCDVMMPAMTGMDFYHAVAAADTGQAERMIFLTGGVFSAPARTFLESIPNACLDKPFDIVRLTALIDDYLV